jgi:hypothetical protein
MFGSKTAQSTPRRRRRILVAGGLVAASAVGTIATAQQASAWPWDPNVNVVGSTSTCVPNGGGWMWYQTPDGDSGWASLWGGNGFTLPLHRVPTSGSIVTLKWGHANCSQVRYFVVSRPAYGNNAAVGNLG